MEKVGRRGGRTCDRAEEDVGLDVLVHVVEERRREGRARGVDMSERREGVMRTGALVAFLLMRACACVRLGVRREGVIHRAYQGRVQRTHGKLVNVLGAGAEERDAEVVDEGPEIGGVLQRAAVVQHQRAACAEAVDEPVPHQPSPIMLCGQGLGW